MMRRLTLAMSCGLWRVMRSRKTNEQAGWLDVSPTKRAAFFPAFSSSCEATPVHLPQLSPRRLESMHSMR